MRYLWKFVLTFVLLPSAIGAVFYFLDRYGYFNLSEVHISVEQSGHSKLTLKKNVENLQADLSKFKNQSLWHLNLMDFSVRLQEEVWVESFNISRRWPSSLHIHVKAYPIYFVYMNNQGQIYPVMGNGEMLKPVGPAESPDVPITREAQFQKSVELRKRAIQLLKDIPLRGSFSRSQVSEIHYNSKIGFSFTLVRDGLVVKMGDEQIRTKSLRVSEVLDYLYAKKFQARVIDANLSQKVLVRLRKEP